MAKTAAKRGSVHLRLYVAGNAPNSVRAIANARAICLEHYDDEWKLEIVDLMEQPLRALADEIIVTPTLLRLQPLPTLRVIGNLNDLGQVFLALGVK
ncbi:MAG: circadian clock protein KaiB [Gemmatimonadaceae bacterium]|nr:circadian clock protein KaiB [Gemmatimonadaceae bacterium]